MRSINYYKVEKINTVKDIIDLAVKEAGENDAFLYKNGNDIVHVTYKQFEQDINSLGTALLEKNITDSHIAVIGENSYNWITVYLTALESNGVFVPIDKELTLSEIVNVLNSSDSEVFFYSQKFEKYVDEIKKQVPKLKLIVGFGKEEDDGEVLSYNKFIEHGKELFLAGKKEFKDIKHTDTDKLKMLVYTSGTTDKPKGVMLTEHNMVSCVYYGLQVSTVYTKCLSVLPYHHTYEAVAGLLVGLHKHVTICINDNLKNVLKNLQLFKPDYIYVVPAFAEIFYKNIWSNARKQGKEGGLKFLIKLSNALRKIGIDKRATFFKSIHEAFGGNLRKIVVGGAPVRAELGSFFDSIGLSLVNGYGITECSPLVSANMDDFNDCATVGVVLPCCQIKFENVGEDGQGEICVKGDIVMKGYYKDPVRTEKVLKDGWFNTEDYGKFNDKGQLMITGRKKNVIVLDNGKNVYPEEIENYIIGIPYIAEVVVKGVKNEIGQDIALCAEVFLNKEKLKELNISDAESSLKSDIAKATKELPTFKHIGKIEIRETEFNKTTTNKIKR